MLGITGIKKGREHRKHESVIQRRRHKSRTILGKQFAQRKARIELKIGRNTAGLDITSNEEKGENKKTRKKNKSKKY
jgi:hypothetical protein